jgi:hypothetical protein
MRHVGLFCSLMELSPVISTLKRMVHDIIDFRTRPKCISADDPWSQGALSLKSSIHPSNMSQPILYPTQFCCTGFGYCLLTENELAHAFRFLILVCVGGISFADFESFLPSQLLLPVLESPEITSSGFSSRLPCLSCLDIRPCLPLYNFP